MFVEDEEELDYYDDVLPEGSPLSKDPDDVAVSKISHVLTCSPTVPPILLFSVFYP